MARIYEALTRAKESNEISDHVAKVIHSPEQNRHQAKLTIPDGIGEEYYRLGHRISVLNSEKRTHVIAFCSSVEGEGTTTVVAQFAVTLATGGERVLLIDANMRKPALHAIFGLEREDDPALLEKTLIEAAKKTSLDNLSVMTAGPTPPLGVCSLGHDTMASFIECMKGQIDWILFDAPPINLNYDGLSLARQVDGIVLVVRAEATRVETVQTAIQHLQALSVRVLGIVLNNRKMYIPGWIYRRV